MFKMSEIHTLIQEKLPMQLDSVSWNKKHDLLALGAYMLSPSDSSKRIGKIFLIHLNIHDDDLKDDQKAFNQIQEVDISGVLDLRWEPELQQKLAVATSNSLELYELSTNNESIKELKLINRIDLEAMALYTQWLGTDKLVFSDSEGVINIVSTDPLQLEKSQKVHDNLTWVVQYSEKSGLLFAGSDEGKFTGFLLENMNDEEKHFTKKFEVGVTSILFIKDDLLAVGSYDDTLRLFTISSTDPILLSLKKKIEFGGAVWRTMSFPSSTEDKFHIVAACARNGIHITELDCTTWGYETLASCLEFEGYLAYGLDAKVESNVSGKSFVIASCYFDNHQLHVWRVSL